MLVPAHADKMYFRLRPSITILNQDPFSVRIDGDRAGVVNSSFHAQAEASSPRETLRFSIASGELPVGVEIDASSGSIQGIPKARGRFAATIKAEDAFSTATADLSIMVYDALEITSSVDPYATVGVPYSSTFDGIGGDQTFNWSLAGTPPAGLSLVGNGTPKAFLAGTPTTVGRADGLRVSVSDGAGHSTSSLPFSVFVADPLALVGTPKLFATVGESYSENFSYSGGHSPRWTQSGLPSNGLTFANGSISGVPNAAQITGPIIVGVEDNAGKRQQIGPFSIVVSGPLALSGTPGAIATVGTAYTAAFVASGGRTAYAWDIASGTLPKGLTLSPTAGSITGSPTEATSASDIVVRVRDFDGRTKLSDPFSVVVSNKLEVAANAIPAKIGTVGEAYSASFTATGGDGNYSWSTVGTPLPTGLSISSTGSITGSPAAAMASTGIIVRVTDRAGRTADSLPFALTVSAPLAVAGNPVAFGTVGTAYNASYTASGGSGGYIWKLKSGTLPTGLSRANGSVAGTPSAAGSFSNIVLSVEDSDGRTKDTTALTIDVSNQLTVSGTISGSGLQGRAFSASVSAAGGRAPYTWASIGSGLPSGLGWSNNTASGTPSNAGTWGNLILRVTDSDGRTAQTNPGTISITNPVTPGSDYFSYSRSITIPAYNSITITLLGGSAGTNAYPCEWTGAEWCYTNAWGGAGGATSISNPGLSAPGGAGNGAGGTQYSWTFYAGQAGAPAPGTGATISIGGGGAAGAIIYLDGNTGYPTPDYGSPGGPGQAWISWN
jgi:hypothetical protein